MISVSNICVSFAYRELFRDVSFTIDRRDRIALVNAAFENVVGQARMFVSPKCRELIKDFEQVGYQEHTTMIDKTSDPRRTHLSDAIGYLVWQECREPIGERRERLF